MGDVPLRSPKKVRDVNWTVAGILGLLIITALAIVPLTVTILQNRESDALLIDLAGQQRMLLERLMNQLLLASQGVEMQHVRTAALLQERVKALTKGGPTAAQFDRGESFTLPPALTEDIRLQLVEQQQLLDAFQVKADRFLHTPPDAPGYAALRDELVRDNAKLLETANAAVALLRQHADAEGRALIMWEIIVVLLVVLLASVRTWRFLLAEKELRKSQAATVEALRQSDAIKSTLLASVSHELRTPLTAVKAMLFSLQEDGGVQPNPVRREFLKSIDEQLDYLNRLVGNLLDMSRLEAGTMVPQREWHLLDELLEGAIRQVGKVLEGRQVQIDVSRELPPIYVDGVQIQQVLVNLLDNAAKFSPADSPIRVAAAVVNDVLEVSVSNRGEGIPPQDVPRVFDRFYRVKTARSSGIPGTGLGLAICKSIVESHGGRITAESIPGGETTIVFRLPMTAQVQAEKPVMAQA